MVKELRTEKNVTGCRRDDMVRRGEFQLLLWMGAFALTTMLGGFTFLYTELSDLRVTMKAEHAQLRTELIAEMKKGDDALRAHFSSDIDNVRSDIDNIRSDIDNIRSDINMVRSDLAALGERMTRVETLLEIDLSPQGASKN